MLETANKKHKSVKLDTAERRDLKRYAKGFSTLELCAAAIGIHRDTLARIIEVGRCHPDTKDKIITALSE